jgi:hypothetical protein
MIASPYPYNPVANVTAQGTYNPPFYTAQFHPATRETLHFAAGMLDFIGQVSCGAIFLLQKTDYFNKLQA